MSKAVVFGAAVVLAVAVPVGLFGALVLDDGSDWVFVLAVPVVASFVVGGYLAARFLERSALVVGALAALTGYAVAQVVSIAVQVAQDEDLRPAAIAANAVLATGFGLVGGAIARR